MSRPLQVEFARPVARSHPYLQGLHMLLRASGLTRVERRGAKARLVIEPEMLLQWNELNATEQYFSLIEAWLRLGSPSMVGSRDRSGLSLLIPCVGAWHSIPRHGLQFDVTKPDEVRIQGIWREFYLLSRRFTRMPTNRQVLTPW